MKKTAFILIVLFCFVAFAPNARAEGDSIRVVVDGRAVAFDVPPQIVNDRVLVPLRAIFEEMGAEIFWDPVAASVIAIKNDTVVVLTIGDNWPTVNGQATYIDQPALIVNGRSLAPLRFVAEAFGGFADWDGANNTAYISTGGGPPPYLYRSTVEYGEPDIIVEWNKPLLAYIRFPHSDDFSGKVIEDWAYDAYRKAQGEMNKLLVSDSAADGEINIHFDSYLVGGRYVGVVEKGMFMHSHMAHPEGIVKTFNYDAVRGAMLSNDDILDNAKQAETLHLLREKLVAGYPETAPLLSVMDASWLDNVAVGPDGIIVMLERGAYLPTYLGNLTVTLPYAELGATLLIPTDAVIAPDTGLALQSPAINASIDPNKPMLALTFDDGPSKHTERILDLLERYGGRATFCVVGNLAENRSDTITRQYNLGCETIGHSYDHRDLTKLSYNEVQAQILTPYGIIDSVTGAAPRLLRTPYGAVNDTVRSAARDHGFSIISWNVDTLDWQSRNADAVYKAVMGEASDRAIILCHDLYSTTADAMERVIPELISKGYQLVTISELININVGAFEAGKVYYSGK